MTKIVAITGGIGSGKSTFSNHLKKLGHLVHESDAVVSEIYSKPKKQFLSFIKIPFKISLIWSSVFSEILPIKVIDPKIELIKVKDFKMIFEISGFAAWNPSALAVTSECPTFTVASEISSPFTVNT